jgi:hypothetical protein
MVPRLGAKTVKVSMAETRAMERRAEVIRKIVGARAME